jgi:hypothetical protein
LQSLGVHLLVYFWVRIRAKYKENEENAGYFEGFT